MKTASCGRCGRVIVYAMRNGFRAWYHLNDGNYERECNDGGDAWARQGSIQR